MSILLKVVGIVMVVVLAVGILGTAIGVGVNVVHYMAMQNFDFGTAVSWSWDQYVEWLKEHNPIKTANADVIEYKMVNRYVEVKPCINL